MTSTVLQSGTITRNHLATWAAPGVIGDAGSSLTPGISSLGIFSNGGLPLAIANTSTPGEPSGPYSQLGFGISQTAAYLNVQSYNGAAPLPLEFIINGVTSFAIAANGSVILNSLTLTTPLGVPSGGTGLSTIPSPGQLLVGNGTGYSLQTLSAGTGINITNFTTIGLANTGTAGTYALPTITVNPQGQVTSAINSPTTGTGNVVLSNSPTLVTPNLGTPSSLILTNAVGLPNSGLINNSITINGTAVPLGGATSIATGLAVGSTPITGGTSGDLLYENGTTLGQLAIGSGLAVASGTLTATGTGGTVTNIATGTGLTGGPITTTGTISLANTTVTTGSYGNGANVATFTVNAQGQITTAGTTAISIPASAINTTIPNSGLTNSSITINGSTVALGGSTTVTAVNPYALTLGTGLSGTSYNGSAAVTAAIANTGVVAGSYGGSTSIPVVTVNAQGQITSISTASVGGGTVTSVNVSGGTTGLTTSGGPVTTAGTITLGGTLGVGAGGTGLVTAPTNGQLLIGNGTNYTLSTLTAGSGISITNAAGGITITSTGGGGSVTSVAASGGTTGLTFTGSPITTAGTLTLGGTLATANGGTGGTATPTAGAVAYGTGTAYAFTVAGTSGQVLTSTGAGAPTWSTPSTGSFQPAYYGTFVSTASQTNGGATTANPVNFDTAALSNGISITSSNRITFANAGVYLIAFELAVTNSAGSNVQVNCWLAQNGTNITNTTSDFTISGGANNPQLLEQQWIVNAAAGDYVQIYWACSATTVSLLYTAAATSPTRPASPSAIVNVALLPPSGSNLAVGSSTVSGGTSGRVLYDNAGVVGEYTITGTAGSVVMSNSPTLTTPALGTPSALVLTNATGLPLTTGVTGILPAANGGTGVNNGTNTLTLAGNLTTSGAFPVTLTATAITALTLPTSGTLATTGNTVASFSAGTTGLTPATATTGAVTLAGTLNTANGGTGLTAFTSGGAVYATSTSALTTGTLPASSGGTGVNNGTNTLTLAGNMTLSGAFATTLTVTGTTNVTLPTTGTLATTANTVASFSAGTTGLTPSTSTTGAVTLAGTLAVGSGGTGQTTASGAFNALSPITSTGDLILGNGVNSATRLPIGANTYVLTSNGTTASWAAPTGSTGPLIYNTTTISSNQTVVAGQNALSVGPMTINSGSTVTVASGQRWLVL